MFFTLLLLVNMISYAQAENENILTLSEYLGYVKKYHPIVKQARLKTTESQIKLLKARGAFDPKIEVDYNRKKFKKTTYYDKLNTSFKIPTWYGVQLKANYENNSGIFLNPEFNVPDNGLYSPGISISLAKGLLTNKRMATLKKAKIYTQQAKADQQLLINDIFYESIIVYLNWLKSYQIKQTYVSFVKNATDRLSNVKKSFLEGDKPAIDTLEANINLKNRLLDLEKSNIKYLKSKLNLSNYLWITDNIPLELENNMLPDLKTNAKINLVLNINTKKTIKANIENNPKVQSLQLKKEQLKIDKRLKINNILPKIDLEYNFLTSKYKNIVDFDTNNYKAGLNISIPIFLRKERSELKLAKLKIQDIDFVISSNKVKLQNKINATLNEIASYKKQNNLLNDLISNYLQIVKAEERKFILGEGSLFRINYREVKLIETKIKSINTYFYAMNSTANLFRITQNSIQ